jgi:hypothetical protein
MGPGASTLDWRPYGANPAGRSELEKGGSAETCVCRRYSVSKVTEQPAAFESVDRVPQFVPFVSLAGQLQNQLVRGETVGTKLDNL